LISNNFIKKTTTPKENFDRINEKSWDISKDFKRKRIGNFPKKHFNEHIIGNSKNPKQYTIGIIHCLKARAT
jgi:hypothetical protein